jgi:hypothetical protein
VFSSSSRKIVNVLLTGVEFSISMSAFRYAPKFIPDALNLLCSLGEEELLVLPTKT